ncbi:hypothetical protein HK097_011239 [Rhizophlyctis rosea]|uniref:Uncharacterized protein n=1 Tax=Rhizophlyctis rosea TaxID=64517 RepID=A0AAD5X013_9FUNG|nr:hypothetical protein HK097_011239 [Rhizophlyctis rosea]
MTAPNPPQGFIFPAYLTFSSLQLYLNHRTGRFRGNFKLVAFATWFSVSVGHFVVKPLRGEMPLPEMEEWVGVAGVFVEAWQAWSFTAVTVEDLEGKIRNQPEGQGGQKEGDQEDEVGGEGGAVDDRVLRVVDSDGDHLGGLAGGQVEVDGSVVEGADVIGLDGGVEANRPDGT